MLVATLTLFLNIMLDWDILLFVLAKRKMVYIFKVNESKKKS